MNCQRCGFEITPNNSHEQIGQDGARQHGLQRCFDLVNGERNVLRTKHERATDKIAELVHKLETVNDPEAREKLEAAMAEIERLKEELSKSPVARVDSPADGDNSDQGA